MKEIAAALVKAQSQKTLENVLQQEKRNGLCAYYLASRQ